MKSIKQKLIILFLLCSSVLWAQDIVVRGKVTDAQDGNPMPGVNITVKDKKMGTITDQSGQYTLKIPNVKQATILFSMLGYKVSEINVVKSITANIKMEEESKMIDEVVVTALGISREAKSLGYARQSVGVESMTEVRSANLSNMLAGKVAGVNVIAGGNATSSTRIEIRGNKSITGNNQPLFVIDGVIIQNDMGDSDDLDYGNIATNINPDDIESMEVLKGANAAALYGSDAANGVILITTKKAKKGKNFGVTYNLNLMFNTISEYPEMQNVYGGGNSHRLGETNKYRDMTRPNMSLMSPYNARSWGIPMVGFDVVGRNGEIKSYIPQPDNVSDYYSTGRQLTNNISISKSNDVASFRFSYTNTNSTDVLKEANKRNRHNLSLRTSYDINRWVSADASVRYSLDEIKNRPYSGWSDRNPMKTYLFLPRDASLQELLPWKDAEGNALKYSSASDSEFKNPYWALYECWNTDKKEWLLADVTLNIKFYKDLNFRLKGAIDSQSGDGYDFTNMGSPWQLEGRYKNFRRNITNYQFEGFFTYNKKIRDFNIGANLGANWRDNSAYRIDAETNKLIIHDVASLSNSAEPVLTKEGLERIRRQSIYGAINVGYKNWVFVDVTARNDWNSTLPIDNCSYFYPSVSGSFIFSDAFDIPQNILSFGKARVSWAKVGNGTSFNQLLNNYAYDGIFNDIPIFTLSNRLKNPNLRPETTYSTEFGLDLRFFKNRLSMDATYYFTRSIDQIVRAKVATSTGYSERVYNTGEVQNRGVEITLNATPIKNKNLSWNMTLNLAHNKNIVKSIMEGVPSLVMATWSSGLSISVEEGQPYGIIRGTDTRYDDEGYAMIQENGRPYTQENVYLGSVQPKMTGSFANTIRYKDFDLGFMFDFKFGGSLFSASAFHGVREGSSLRSLQFRDEYLFSSTVLGEDANERNGINSITGLAYGDNGRIKGGYFPGRIYVQDASTGNFTLKGDNQNYISPQTYWQNASGMYGMFVYDASFIKLRELSLGYTVPSKMLRKLPIQGVRLALVARNLWTLYQNTPKGIDPQATASSGNDQGLEAAFALPQAYYGFDFKILF